MKLKCEDRVRCFCFMAPTGVYYKASSTQAGRDNRYHNTGYHLDLLIEAFSFRLRVHFRETAV